MIKTLDNFRYRKDREIYYSQCKECEKKYKKKNYLENIEARREYRENYYRENKNKIVEKILLHQKTNGTWMKKYNSDPIFRMNHNVRCRIREFLTEKNIRKKNKTSEIVGCSKLELMDFLEKKFKDGMSWNNYGEWHIDHIIPLSCAKSEEDILKLCHFTNLQPLWRNENFKKGKKIIY